jgi:hypothetical protein
VLADGLTTKTWGYVFERGVIRTISVGEMQGISQMANISIEEYQGYIVVIPSTGALDLIVRPAPSLRVQRGISERQAFR